MKAEKKHHICAERCKSCGLCVNTCPKKTLAIGNVLNQQGYNVVEQVKPKDCILCDLCRIICPDVAIAVIKPAK